MKTVKEWINEGKTFSDKGQYKEAIICYDKAIELNPNNETAWNNKGYSLKELQSHEEAIACYDKAILLKPKDEYPWNNKGYSLICLKRYEEAMSCLDMALIWNSSFDFAWKNKGICFAKQSYYVEASECFKKIGRSTSYILSLSELNDEEKKEVIALLENSSGSSKVVKNKVYKTFQDFFNDVLSPYGEFYKLLNTSSGFVYRGESSNQYKLLPTALRAGAQEKMWNYMGTFRKEFDIVTRQIFLEYQVIASFYLRSNYFGLQLPRIPFIEQVYHGSLSFALRHNNVWINQDLQEIAALAQHYGVPTRLLDWTQDINTALYFAAVNVLKKIKENTIDKSDNLVIWALDSKSIQNHNIAKVSEYRTNLKLITPPYSNNPNLNAQKGVLSYWEIGYDPEWWQLKVKNNEMTQSHEVPKVDKTPLNELLQKAYENSEHTILYKFELPITKAINVFDYLMSMKHTAGKIFPGYAGIAKEMEERGLFYDVIEKMKQSGIELEESYGGLR